MALSRTAEKYQRELRTLADSLPFKKVELPEFKSSSFTPNQVRQKRIYTSPDRNMQAIGRFLIERGTVELLTPENTMDLFREMHWCAFQLRKLSRKRLESAREWHRAVVKGRSMISQIEAAEEERELRLADSGVDLAGVDEAVLMRIEAPDMARALESLLGAGV